MKEFWNNLFLVKPAPEPGWTVRRRELYYAWRIFMVFCAGLCMGLALLVLAVGPYSKRALIDYLCHWQTLLLNTLPVGLLVLLFYGVAGRTGAAFLLGGGIAFGFSLGNYYKLQFRDDPLYFEDMLVLREAKAMTVEQHYNLFIDKRMVFALVCLALGTAALCFLARGRLGGWKKRLIVLGAVALVCGAVSPAYLNKKAYDAVENYEYLNRWSATQNYISHGFFYPFFHSISEFVETPPPGYSEERAKQVLGAYQDADIPADKKVNILSFMREAYVDFSRYGIPGLDVSGYDLYHQLEAESYTGDLLTNIFAGGTVDSERCFLTGNYQLKNFRAPANSHLWYLRDQGYTVEGSHPYYQWFYNRQNINQYLGFERFRYLEGDYENLTTAYLPEDGVLLPEVYNDFVKNKSTGKPYFSFTLNIQSHGPYDTASYDGGVEYLTGDYSEGCRNAMNNYMDLIMDSDVELMKLVDKLRSDPDPVVLILFSDHLPWMGDANAYYQELGLDIDPGTEAGFRTHYTTRYLIWANEAAKTVLGSDFSGEGPTVSPCYLMNLAFQQMGWQGSAYLQAMDAFSGTFPVVTTNGCYVVDGVFSDAVPQEREAWFQDFLSLQYYWRNQFLFGE